MDSHGQMNDQHQDQPAQQAHEPPAGAGTACELRAKRQTPSASDSRAIGRWFAKDPINTVLIVASIGLTILFFTLLGEIQPSSQRRPRAAQPRRQAGRSTSRSSSRRCSTKTPAWWSTPRKGCELYAAYPNSDAETSSLLKELTESGAVVEVDQQADKPSKQIMVQFLIPILLLVCLFVLFTRLGQDGGAGAFAGFSKFTGKGRKRKARTRPTAPPSTTSPAPAKRWPSCARSATTSPNPGKYAAVGAARPEGRAAGRPARAPARRCSPRRPPARPTRPSSRSRARTSSSRWSASAPPASATSSPRRASRRRRSSSSTSSTPPGASAAPASARATTSASRR